jgi:hypothetical protein
MRSANEEIHDLRRYYYRVADKRILGTSEGMKRAGAVRPRPSRNITDGSLYYRAAKMPAIT